MSLTPFLHASPVSSATTSSAQTSVRTHTTQPASPAASHSSLESDANYEDIQLRPLLTREARVYQPVHQAAAVPQRPHVTYAQVSYPDPPSYAEATGIVHPGEHFELGKAYPNARALHVGNWIGLRVGLLARAVFNAVVSIPGYALVGAALCAVLAGAAHLDVRGASAKAQAANYAFDNGLDALSSKVDNDVRRAL